VSVIELAISPGRVPGQFRVEVVSSPAGEASSVTDLDIEALLARRRELEQAVLVSAVSTRKLLHEEQRVQEIGRVLFLALLGAGEVAGRYRAAVAVAAERGEGLRVVLRIGDPALAGLPWEAMYDEAAGSYVCRRNQLVRHVGVPSAATPLPVTPPLRILGIVSSPRGLALLDVDKEKDQLTRALRRLSTDGLVDLTWAPSATWADLQDTLLSGEWHVVHFIGHGDFDPDRDEGVLALTGEDGRMHLVQASRLVDLLGQARPVPRLVVLNSCSGAATGVTDLFSATAAALVRGGVSAVAAMQYEISDAAAVAFARGFYGAIARGRGVDEAVSSGRVAIIGLSDRTLEWVTPVLYLRGQDGHLFTVPAAHATARAPAQREQGVSDFPSSLVRTLTVHPSEVTCVAFSPDGAVLASAGAAGVIWLCETATGAPVRPFAGHSGSVYAVTFSLDGSLLASCGADGTIRLWHVDTGTEVRALTRHQGQVRGVTFSPDGLTLASAGVDKTVRLWETANGKQRQILRGHTRSVREVAYSPEGTLIASGGGDETVRLWDAATGAQLRVLSGHTNGVWGVAFNPDGDLLASAADDRTIRLWETTRGTQTRVITGHTEGVWGAVFSPDGSILASAGDDQTVRLWDWRTGTELCVLTGHTASVCEVRFSPDGRLLASASEDGTVRLWS
jgi:WD40 repeat protein